MDVNDKIAANTKLIYKQLAAFNLLQDPDAESDAYEALWRSVTTFDTEAGVAFSTYAVCCINNALRKHLRTLNKKRQLDVVSYDAQLTPDDSASCFADIIDYGSSAEQMLLSREESARIVRAFNEEYELLSPKHQETIRTFYVQDGKMTQKEIATSVGLTQATVSKIVSAFRYRVRLRMEESE